MPTPWRKVRVAINLITKGDAQLEDALRTELNRTTIERAKAIVPPFPPPIRGLHSYLSTGCLHGRHSYCQGTDGQAGPKTPSTCKWCPAKCRCACHQDET